MEEILSMKDLCMGMNPQLKVSPLNVVKKMTSLKKKVWWNSLVGPPNFYSHYNIDGDYITSMGDMCKVRAVGARTRQSNVGRGEGGVVYIGEQIGLLLSSRYDLRMRERVLD
jgi:hypothetical protein